MPISNKPKASQIKADEPFRRRLSEFIETHGEQETNRLLETPRNTLARVAAGLPVRRATLAFVSMQLDKVAPVDSGNASNGANLRSLQRRVDELESHVFPDQDPPDIFYRHSTTDYGPDDDALKGGNNEAA